MSVLCLVASTMWCTVVRELAAAGVHASRFLSFLLSRCTASRSPQLRSVGQTVTILSSSGAWLAFVVLRVINVVVSGMTCVCAIFSIRVH